jgi:hypothetical protein
MLRQLALGSLGFTIVLAGCGSTSRAPTFVKPSASPSLVGSSVAPSSQRLPLFAFLQNGAQKATIILVSRDGAVHTRQTFIPPSQGEGCGDAGWPARIAVTAGNAVFYMDSAGTVHSLAASGNTKAIATFSSVTAQTLTWFAISPDGQRVLASLVQFNTCGNSWGPKSDTLEEASIGSSPRVIAQPSIGQTFMVPVGWDTTGPIVTPDASPLGIPSPHGQIWLGHASYLGPQGQLGTRLGGNDCTPYYGMVSSRNLICYTMTQPTVRDSAGAVLWSLRTLSADFFYADVFLSPDAMHVAFSLYTSGLSYDSSVLRSRDGARVQLPARFMPQGWTDADTIVGTRDDLIGVIDISSPTAFQSLGLNGPAVFLGVLH